MAVLQEAGRISPPHVCVIKKTPCGIRLTSSAISNLSDLASTIPCTFQYSSSTKNTVPSTQSNRVSHG